MILPKTITKIARFSVVCATTFPIVAPSQTPTRLPHLVDAVATSSPIFDGGYEFRARAARDVTRDLHFVVVASHPDDPYLMVAARQRSFGYRVTVVLATRGEGGQNSTGPELGAELGKLRTLESEAAAGKLGFAVRYLSLPDAGYCRSASEAFDTWGRSNATRQLARIIRELQPDVVVTTHHADEPHGHDLGLIEILAPAVRLAADPQWKEPGTTPHETRRTFRGASDDETPDLVLDMTAVDPVSARTFRQIAYDVLVRYHASQGPFRPMNDLFAARVGLVHVRMGTDEPVVDYLHEGIPDLWQLLADTSYSALGIDLDQLGKVIQLDVELADEAVRLHRELTDLARNVRGATASRKLQQRIRALERLIVAAIGLRVSVEPQAPDAAMHESEFDVKLHVQCGHISGVRTTWRAARGIASVRRTGGEDADPVIVDLEYGSSTAIGLQLKPSKRVRGPYDSSLFGRRSEYEIPIALSVSISIPNITKPLTFEVPLPIELQRGVRLEVKPRGLLIPNNLSSLPFNVRVTRTPGATTLLSILDLDAPTGMMVAPNRIAPKLRDPERFWEQIFELRIDESFERGPTQLFVRIGSARLRIPVARIDCKVPEDLRVGLIRGVDDTTSGILRSLRGLIDLVQLTGDELPTRNLNDLDTIIIDVRALARQPETGAVFGRLLDFVAGGGRLVVFYHKGAEFNLSDSGFRGFPADTWLHIGRGRVTREDAPIRTLHPDHRIFTEPNKIVPSDWDNWVHERGLYFADEWSEDYVPLLETADPGQPAERGALLYAQIDQGEYIYCALSMYRQLDRLHPGASRLFFNLITPKRRRSQRDL